MLKLKVTETNCNIPCGKQHSKGAETEGTRWVWNGVGSVEEGPVSMGQAREKIHQRAVVEVETLDARMRDLDFILKVNGSTEKIKMKFGIKKQKQNQKTLFDQLHGSTKGGLNEAESTWDKSCEALD